MQIGHIILLTGMSLIVGVPLWIWTQIPKWGIFIITPVLAIVLINLIGYIIDFLEKDKDPFRNGTDTDIEIDKKWNNNIFKETLDEIKHALGAKPPCGKCGSTDVALILYGLTDLDEKMKSMIDEGKITLGGCIIGEDSPKWVCNDCKHTYGK